MHNFYGIHILYYFVGYLHVYQPYAILGHNNHVLNLFVSYTIDYHMIDAQ